MTTSSFPLLNNPLNNITSGVLKNSSTNVKNQTSSVKTGMQLMSVPQKTSTNQYMTPNPNYNSTNVKPYTPMTTAPRTEIPQTTSSRFIGFQTPSNTIAQNTNNVLSGKTNLLSTLKEKVEKDKTKKKLDIPTKADYIKASDNQKATNYISQLNVVKDLQADMYKNNGPLTAQQIQKAYPELSNNIDRVMELQSNLRPIVKNGEYVANNQITQHFPDILQDNKLQGAQALKDYKKQVEDTEKENKKIFNNAKTVNQQVLSANGKDYANFLIEFSKVPSYMRNNYKIDKNVSDSEILSYVLNNSPEYKAEFDRVNNLDLSDLDKAYLGIGGNWLNQFSAGVQKAVNQANTWYQQNVSQPLSDVPVIGGLTNTAGTALGGMNKTLTNMGQLANGEFNSLGEIASSGIKGMGGSLGMVFGTAYAPLTAAFDVAGQSELGRTVEENTIGLVPRGITYTLENTPILKDFYNSLDDEAKADLANELTIGLFKAAGIAAKKTGFDIKAGVAAEALSNALQRGKYASKFQIWVEKGLADDTGKFQEGALGRILKEGGKEFGSALRENLSRFDEVVKARQEARNPAPVDNNYLDDKRSTGEKVRSDIKNKVQDVKEKANEVGDSIKEAANTIKEKAKDIKNKVTSKNEIKVAEDSQGIVDRISDWGARKITGTTEAQDKLYKAQEPRMNILSNRRNLEQRRANSDRANELIVENGYTPTDTTSRLKAHEDTMKNIWSEIESKINSSDLLVDKTALADVLDDYIKEQESLGSTLNQKEITALKQESQKLRGQITDLMTLEKQKQLYNSVINNWGDQKVSDTLANGLRTVTKEIGKLEDIILSKVPGEFSKLKRDFGALKDTYEDVFKADMKNQRKKGLGLTETYSRIEGVGDMIEGLLGILSGNGTKVIKGAGKIMLGKSLAKASNNDFLIKEGFKELSNKLQAKGGNKPDTTAPKKDNTPKKPNEGGSPKNKVTSKTPQDNNRLEYKEQPKEEPKAQAKEEPKAMQEKPGLPAPKEEAKKIETRSEVTGTKTAATDKKASTTDEQIVQLVKDKELGRHEIKDANGNIVGLANISFNNTVIGLVGDSNDYTTSIQAFITRDPKGEKVDWHVGGDVKQDVINRFNNILKEIGLGKYMVGLKDGKPSVMYKPTGNVKELSNSYGSTYVGNSRLRDTDITRQRNAEEQAEYDRKVEENRAENQRIREKLAAEEKARQEAQEKAKAEERARRKNVVDYVEDNFDAGIARTNALRELTQPNKDARTQISYIHDPEIFPKDWKEYENTEVWELLDKLAELKGGKIDQAWEREYTDKNGEHHDVYSYYFELNPRKNEKGRRTNDYRTPLSKRQRDYLSHRMRLREIEEEKQDMKANPNEYVSEEDAASLFKPGGTTVKTKGDIEENITKTLNNLKSYDDLSNIFKLKEFAKDENNYPYYHGLLNDVPVKVWDTGDSIHVRYGSKGEADSENAPTFRGSKARVDKIDKDYMQQLSELLREINNDGEILESNRYPSKPQTTTEITGEKNAITAKTAPSNEPKNKVTSDQVVSELQQLADKNGLLEYDGNTFTYRYPGTSFYTPQGAPIMEGENVKVLRKYQGGIILTKQLQKAFDNGFEFDLNGKTVNKDNYSQIVNDNDDLIFYSGRKQSYGTDLDYLGRIPLKEFLDKYGKQIQEKSKGIDNGQNTNIIGKNNSLTSNNTKDDNNRGENEQGVGGSVEISRGAVTPKISDSQSVESRSNIQEQSYSNGERYANTSMNTNSVLGDGSRTGGTQQVLTRADQRKVNQDTRDILERHGFSQNRIDYTPQELDTLLKFEGNGGLANATDTDIKGSRYEFYTPEAPTKALQRGIQKYSDIAITKVIDPTGGKGNLFAGLADTIEKEMYEINKVSGTVAKLRFPEMNVHIGETDGDYQNRFKDFMGNPTKTPTNGSLNASAIVGNPPFGERIKVRDDKGIKRLEEYFIKRPIEVDLVDKGIAGYVMPSTWLRGKDTVAKKWLAENTQIVDAYRLPAGVFSYTDVGTDLIILKKVKPEQKSDLFFDNNYFKQHPEKVLGEEKTRVRGFGEELYIEGDPKVIDTLWNDVPSEKVVVEKEAPKNKITSGEKTKVTTTPTEVEEKLQEPKGEFKPDEKAKNLVTSKPKAATTVKQWKKQPKVTVYKGDKTDTGTFTYGDTSQLKIMEAVDPDGFVDINKAGVSLDKVKAGQEKGLNYAGDNKVQPDFLYFSGDIYEKLDQLEKDYKEGYLEEAQYKKQKEGLKAVMPPRRQLQDIQFSVLDEQLMATETSQLIEKNLKNPETGRREDTNVKATIEELFWRYMTGGSTSWSAGYKRDGIFQGTGTNPQNIRDYYSGKKNMKKEDQGPAKERADIIFNDFIKNSLPEEEKLALEEKYNRDYVAVVRPNYENMPIKVDGISATFHGQPLNLSPVQRIGVKAMVSKGSMSIAHGVGYGKTLEGITATEILLQRGWIDRPMLIVPKGTKRDWIRTYNEAFPNREIVDLGGLLAADRKRLTEEFGADPRNWLKDGQVGVLTHSGFERNLSFKQAWINELTRGLRDVMETKNEDGSKRKKSARKQDEEQEKLEATAEGTAETKTKNSKAMIALAKYNPEGLKDLTNKFEGYTYEDFKQAFKDRFTKEKVGNEEQGYFDNPYKIDVAEDIMNADIDAMWSMRPVYVEDLGIDHVVVDEVHNFKNIFKSAETEKDEDGRRVKDSRFGNVQGSSSARGRKMYSLTQYILQNNGGRGVFSLSATPFNNQALEVYNILSLQAYNRLLEMGIRNINDFFGKFADFREDLVAKANGQFEFKDIMVSFKNVRELQRLLLEYMDYRADNPDLVRPENVVKKVELDMSDLQQSVQDGIEAQLNDETALKNNPGLMLKLIGQMRLNLISPYLTENYKDITPTRQELIESSPKLKFSLDAIKRLRDEGNNDGVFIFMPYMGEDGVLHNVLKQAIEEYVGRDRVSVGIINGKTTGTVKDEDGESIDKKTAIANEFRTGKINVLIGGENTVEGINLQDEGYMTIDLLLGRNPTQTIQLFGRVRRQGNLRNHTIQLLPLMRNSGDIVMLQKFLEKSSRINDLLSFQGLLFNVEDLDSNEERLALLTDINKKADLQILLDDKKYQKDDQKLVSQEEQIKKVLEKEVQPEEVQRVQERVDKISNEVEQYKQALDALPEENPAYRGVKSDLDNAKYRLEAERKDLRKLKEQQKYVENKLAQYNVNSIEELRQKLEEIGEQRKDIANLRAELKDSRPAIVQKLREQRDEDMKNQKSYDEYLDDMSYLYGQKKKFATKADLKERLAGNKVDRPSDTRNSITSNDKNKITSK